MPSWMANALATVTILIVMGVALLAAYQWHADIRASYAAQCATLEAALSFGNLSAAEFTAADCDPAVARRVLAAKLAP